MIIDKLNEFANAVQLPTSGTGWFNIGNVVDLQALRDIGRGKPSIFLAILINQAVTSGSSATVQFALASDSQQPLRTDGTTENLHLLTAAIAKATLLAGYMLVLEIPLESPAYARYLGIQANIGTAALTAGAVSAFVALDAAAFKGYPSAVFA